MNSDSTADTSSPQAVFPIKTVANLTGVNPITLRAWEKRYGLISPKRSASGHRLYSQRDIELINEVVELVASGIPISQVTQALTERERKDTNDVWSSIFDQMLMAVHNFDEVELNKRYNEVLALYPIDVVIKKLIIPLLEELGSLWQQHGGGIAEEHFFGVFLRNKLGARFHHQMASVDGPRLLAACLPGERHENGLLLFALSAQSHGFQVTVLGANMPVDELLVVTERTKFDGIVLSGSVCCDFKTVFDQIKGLADKTNIPIFVGGNISSHYYDDIVRSQSIPLGQDISSSIRRVLQVLNSNENNDTTK